MNEHIEIINGIKYYFKTEKVLYFQSESLRKTIKGIPVSKLCDNYKIEIGFSLYILKKREHDEAYDILIPDYKKLPFTDTTDDLSLAFLIQLEQVSLLQKYNLSGIVVRFDDEIMVAKDALTKSTICLQRFHELNGSGWCINEILQDHDGRRSGKRSVILHFFTALVFDNTNILFIQCHHRILSRILPYIFVHCCRRGDK